MKTLSFLFRENAPISSRLNAVDLYLVVCIFFVFGKTFSAADVFLIQLKLSIFSCLAGVCRNIVVAEEEAETTDEVGDGDDEEHDGQWVWWPPGQERTDEEAGELKLQSHG